MMPRRDFLLASLAATAAAALPSQGGQVSAGLIDTNVWLGRWPIRDLPLAGDPAALAAKLKANGVTRGWASSFDGLMHKDIASVNSRLAESCHAVPMFEPIGALNPTLPRWEADVAACAALKMHGIRLTPSYHGYKLDDPRFVEVLKLATSLKLVVQISLILEDERTQNPLMRVPPPDITPLAHSLAAAPGARVMLLNWLNITAGKPVLFTLATTDVMFDIAMLEGIAGIEAAIESVPVGRLCFGSYAPVFYHEAAKLKLHESELSEAQLAAIAHDNAHRLLFA